MSNFSPVLTCLAAIVPLVPQNITVLNSGLGSITLTWLAPTDDGGNPIIGYYIYYKLSGNS